MALIANNISGSINNFSRVGITGSVIIANRPGSDFPQIPGPDVTFFVSGSGDGTGKSVFGGDLISSSSFNLKNPLNGISQFSVSSTGMLINDSSGTPTAQIAASTGDITTSGDLAINGGDVTSSAVTFNLLNSGQSSLNFGASAAAIGIGTTSNSNILIGTTSTNLFISAQKSSIKSHSGYTGSELVTLTSAVTTTDSTPTAIYTLPLSDNHAYWIEASIIGNQTNSTNRAYYVRQCLAYRSGGNATIQTGVLNNITVESNSSWDASMSNSGNNILIYVVGPGSTVYWTATIKYQAISTSS